MPLSSDPVIVLDQISKDFGNHRAVDDVSIAVAPGEVFGLLGPNGAGKSTLIKMLTTLIKPSSGQAMVAGFNIAQQPLAVRRQIGYVPQALSVDSTLTGYENLLIMSKFYGLSRQQRRKRIGTALHLVGLAGVAHQMVTTYSGGMVRRLEIAQATLHRPQVLFLDEPTVGLDPVARRAMWELVQSLRADYGTTVLLTTHFMEEADVLCDRIAILHQGQVVALATPQNLKASLPEDNASLDDAFIHYTGTDLSSGGTYRNAATTRRTAQRLG
jgi:ABC-2 type transport system ATP-binding protein